MSFVDLRESSEGGFYGEDDIEFNFPFTYYGGEYGIDNFDDGYEVLSHSRSETGTPLFYPTVADSQYEEGLFEPIFTEQTEAAFGSIGDKSSTTSTSPQPEKVSPETRRVSMFVHSCPSHFSDINRARKSVFGSIFLRTTGRVVDETNLLKSITESNYSMLQSLLSSFERVISLVPSDTERKHMMQAYKESVMRMLEHSGIRRTYSDGSIHWDIYPIAQSYLFTLQVDDHIHQTRNLSKIEERIISGTTQTLRVPYEWPTSSVWSGNWDGLGMSGSGTYTMPHGVQYNGKMKDGMFHDDNATLTYPNKFKAINCVYDRGILKDCHFQFPDTLLHEKENWAYCKQPDRRFWSEVRKGFKPAKIAQKTEVDPPRKIPAGCYDTNDGFYNPRNLTLLSPTGELLRVPVCEEAQWIKKYCRKGFLEPTGFRPDLYENWYDGNFEFIDEILRQHEKFRQQKITYDELQQFYADNGLLSSCSKYQRRLTEHEILKIERNRGAIDPVKIRTKKVKKYIGHKLSDLLRSESSENLEKETTIATLSMKSLSTKKSKSFIKFNDDTRVKSVTGIASRMSKINFKISNDSLAATVDDTNASTTPKDIPHVYLSHQPIQRPPFQTRVKQRPPKTVSSKCVTRTESEANLPVDGGDDQLKHLKKKRLQKFMKDMILEIVVKFLLEERERHRSRLFWASKVVPHEKAPSSHKDKCLEVLENLFESIPEREEYTDSDPSKTCNFKKLSEDRYNTLKYWGKRLYTLDFDSDDKEENK